MSSSFKSRLLRAAALATCLVGGMGTAHALDVLTVPQNPLDTTVPQGAINGESTRFMAIARDGAAPYTVSWDFDGNGTWDTTFNTNNAYNLAADHTYPNQANDNLFVANVRVVDGGGNTAFGSFPVLVHANVPSIANANSATDEQMAVIRNRAIIRGLWNLHNRMISRGGAGAAITGYLDKTDGYRNGIAVVDQSITGAFLWGLALNGHYPAYPPGTYAGPSTADWVAQNNTLWNNSPFSEDAVRLMNWLLTQAQIQGGLSATEEGDDGQPAIAGTNNGQGIYWASAYEPNYIMPHVLGGLSVATAPLIGTVTQAGPNGVTGQSWPYIIQESLDWLVYSQMDGNNNTSGMGAWYYVANGSGAGAADGSTTQWCMIGIEAAYRTYGSEGVILNNFVRSRMANQLRFAQGSNGGVKYRNSSGDGRILITGGGLVGSGILGWNDLNQFNCDGSNGVDVNEQIYLPYSNLTRCQARNIYEGYYNYTVNIWNQQWSDSNYNSGCTSCGKIYAIYSNQKGARSMIPELEFFGAHDWDHQFTVFLARAQHNDGYWNTGGGDSISTNYVGIDLGTAYSILILTPTLFDPKPEAVGDVNPQTVVEGCSGEGAGVVNLDHSDSFHPDPENQIVAYQWDIDASNGLWWDTGAAADFQTADRNQTFTHTYSTRGSYTVTLRTVDQTQPEAGVDLATFTVTVEAAENLAPSANANGAYVINDGDDLTLNGSGSDANANCGDSISAAWD
ncbi:MAG: PKD domain-containing protein, partial [Bradymonadia bacterium]